MTFKPARARTRWLVLVLLVYSPPCPRITASTVSTAKPNTRIAIPNRARYVVRKEFYKYAKEEIDSDILRDFAEHLSEMIPDKNRVILPDVEPSLPCTEEWPCEQVCFSEHSLPLELRKGVDELRIEVYLMRDPREKDVDPKTIIFSKDDPAGPHYDVQPPILTLTTVRETLIRDSRIVPQKLKEYDNDPHKFLH